MLWSWFLRSRWLIGQRVSAVSLGTLHSCLVTCRWFPIGCTWRHQLVLTRTISNSKSPKTLSLLRNWITGNLTACTTFHVHVLHEHFGSNISHMMFGLISCYIILTIQNCDIIHHTMYLKTLCRNVYFLAIKYSYLHDYSKEVIVGQTTKKIFKKYSRD